MTKSLPINRRDFMRLLGIGGASLGFGFKIPSTAWGATGVTGGFRAMICLEQLGGCDNFLFSSPLDTSRKNALINRRGQHQTAYYNDPNLFDLGFGTNIAMHPALKLLEPYLDQMRITLGCGNAMHVATSGSHETQQIRMALGTDISPSVRTGWKARMFDNGAQLIGFSGGRPQDFQCQSDRCRSSPPLVTDLMETFNIAGARFNEYIQGGRLNTEQVAAAIESISNIDRDESGALESRYQLGQRSMFSQLQDIDTTLINHRSPLYDEYLLAAGASGTAQKLSQRFRNIAQVLKRMKDEGATDRIIFAVPQGGYDTHDSWSANNNSLMHSLGSALRTFLDDCVQMGILDQVVVHTETEFGRQLAANGGDYSAGTDHGQAFSALTIGGQINGGSNIIYGDMLTSQQIANDYNWSPRIDSRALVAEIIQHHLQLDPNSTAFVGGIANEFVRPSMALFRSNGSTLS